MSLKIVSSGLSSGLRLGRLVHCRPSRRINDRVARSLIGCAGSRSRANRRGARIPSPHAPQELPDEPAPFAWEEGPVDAAVVDFVEQEQVEPAAGLLVALQDQAAGPGVPS